MIAVMQAISQWALPIIIVAIPLFAFIRGVPVYEIFIEGAEKGFPVAVKIIPHLVGMLVAIGIFRASGALDFFLGYIQSVLSLLAIPGDVVPLAIIRPLSGSGALGILAEIMRAHGADSLIARIASTMQGSTDTTLYIVTVYFGSVGIRNPRHAVIVGLCADAAGLLAAVWICRLVFGP